MTTAKILLAVASPRPGPASLLSSSTRPQHGHVVSGGGRAGLPLRAATEEGTRKVAGVCRQEVAYTAGHSETIA